MDAAFASRPFGTTGVSVGALGLGSSFGLPAREVERAYERGVNFFLWGSLRKNDFGLGLRNLAPKHREGMVVAVQSYTRMASLMEWSVNRALRFMKTDYVDVLCLAWWNGPPPRRIVDAALKLRDKGKIRQIMVSCHHRPAFAGFVKDPAIDSLMVRYNAAHPGAEREVFPHLAERRLGTVAFTATRWGTLLDSNYMPEGAATPRPSDCYRFALSNPNVDVCLAGPKDAAQLDEALVTLERGPMDAAELAWMRRVGASVRDLTGIGPKRLSPMDILDRVASFSLCSPKQLST